MLPKSGRAQMRIDGDRMSKSVEFLAFVHDRPGSWASALRAGIEDEVQAVASLMLTSNRRSPSQAKREFACRIDGTSIIRFTVRAGETLYAWTDQGSVAELFLHVIEPGSELPLPDKLPLPDELPLEQWEQVDVPNAETVEAYF